MNEIAAHTPYTPTDADRKFAEASLERARLQAAGYLPQLLDIMVEKALDPSATAKAVQDAAEFTYKVSGLSGKQEQKQATGATIVFNLSGGKQLTVSNGASAKTIEAEPADALECSTGNILDSVPSYISDLVVSTLDDESYDMDLSDE
ncbi:MAG: hypothetical protein A2Y38_14660 [Spirochaetes bacterium GWB1_59_5]|nr:MAG: hypothetical protein A2Y38_14660 [Spirochaetes bacterium GWB1_59_5]